VHSRADARDIQSSGSKIGFACRANFCTRLSHKHLVKLLVAYKDLLAYFN
jgi:hypothetical protein